VPFRDPFHRLSNLFVRGLRQVSGLMPHVLDVMLLHKLRRAPYGSGRFFKELKVVRVRSPMVFIPGCLENTASNSTQGWGTHLRKSCRCSFGSAVVDTIGVGWERNWFPKCEGHLVFEARHTDKHNNFGFRV
jgi:hypothetical protein